MFRLRWSARGQTWPRTSQPTWAGFSRVFSKAAHHRPSHLELSPRTRTRLQSFIPRLATDDYTPLPKKTNFNSCPCSFCARTRARCVRVRACARSDVYAAELYIPHIDDEALHFCLYREGELGAGCSCLLCIGAPAKGKLVCKLCER